MSHELRTPLNAIIGYSDMLVEEAQDAGNDHAVADLQKIQRSGKHLLALINGILDLSKIEAGRMEIVRETFSIADLLDELKVRLAKARPLPSACRCLSIPAPPFQQPHNHQPNLPNPPRFH